MATNPPFEPVSRRTISEQIREQVLKRIESGDLPPGARVPSERDLCTQFGVARTSVREAMQGLASIGLIERRGNRSYVAELVPGFRVDNEDDERKRNVRELFETRRVLELPIFELACRRADDEDLARMLAIAAKFDEPLSLDEFRQCDREFHTTIAAACDNPLLMELYGKVLDALFQSEAFDSLLYASANKSEVEAIVEHASSDHATIIDAIMARNPAAVLAASAAHLDDVEARMLDKLV